MRTALNEVYGTVRHSAALHGPIKKKNKQTNKQKRFRVSIRCRIRVHAYGTRHCFYFLDFYRIRAIFTVFVSVIESPFVRIRQPLRQRHQSASRL